MDKYTKHSYCEGKEESDFLNGVSDGVMTVSYTHLKIKQEVHQIREENKEGITQIQTDMGEWLERVYGNLNNMEGQINTSKNTKITIEMLSRTITNETI